MPKYHAELDQASQGGHYVIVDEHGDIHLRTFLNTDEDKAMAEGVANALNAVLIFRPYDAEAETDAARWRALMSSERMHFMGSAGFAYKPERGKLADVEEITPRPGETMHFGIEFWDKYRMTEEERAKYPDTFERKLMLTYVDAIRANGLPTVAPTPVAAPADPWADHPIYTGEDWRNEVANCDTRRGYLDWVAAKIEEDSAG